MRMFRRNKAAVSTLLCRWRDKRTSVHITKITMLTIVTERLKWNSLSLITRLNWMKSSLVGFLVIMYLGSSITSFIDCFHKDIKFIIYDLRFTSFILRKRKESRFFVVEMKKRDSFNGFILSYMQVDHTIT